MTKEMSLLLLSAILSASCSSNKKLDNYISEHNCEAAFNAIPQVERNQSALGSPLWATKNIIAYTYIGANYTAEVLWDGSVGVASAVILCMPFSYLAVKGAAFYGATTTPFYCLPFSEQINTLRSPPLGRQAIKQTKQLRCPNIDELYLAMQKVATCYEQTNQKQKALQTLETLENSKYFFSCLDIKKQRAITLKKQDLKKEYSQ